MSLLKTSLDMKQDLAIGAYHKTGKGQLEMSVIMATGATLSMAISNSTGAKWLGIHDKASLMRST